MQSAEQAAAAAASAEGQESSLVRAPVKHVLSQELQLYFDRVAQLLRAKPGNAPGQGQRVVVFMCSSHWHLEQPVSQISGKIEQTYSHQLCFALLMNEQQQLYASFEKGALFMSSPGHDARYISPNQGKREK